MTPNHKNQQHFLHLRQMPSPSGSPVIHVCVPSLPTLTTLSLLLGGVGGHSKDFSGPSQTKAGQCVYSQIPPIPSPPCWASKGRHFQGSLSSGFAKVQTGESLAGRALESIAADRSVFSLLSAPAGVSFSPRLRLPLASPPGSCSCPEAPASGAAPADFPGQVTPPQPSLQLRACAVSGQGAMPGSHPAGSHGQRM